MKFKIITTLIVVMALVISYFAVTIYMNMGKFCGGWSLSINQVSCPFPLSCQSSTKHPIDADGTCQFEVSFE